MTTQNLGLAGEPIDVATWMAVNEILQSYADSIDRGDIPGILSLFAVDAIWEYSPGRRHRGHDEIGGFFAERMPAFSMTSHNVGPPVVRCGPTSDSLTSTAYFTAKHILHDKPTYCVWGRYVDQFGRVDGSLLITRRAVLAHVTEGTSRSYNMLPRVSAQPTTSPDAAE